MPGDHRVLRPRAGSRALPGLLPPSLPPCGRMIRFGDLLVATFVGDRQVDHREVTSSDPGGAPAPRRRGPDAPGRARGSARLRGLLRPSRGSGLLARLPDRRQPHRGRGRDAGGAALDLAQRRPLRPRPRQRPRLDPRHRPQSGDRPAPQGVRSLAQARRRRRGAARDAARRRSSPTPRRCGARRRARSAARSRNCPTTSPG